MPSRFGRYALLTILLLLAGSSLSLLPLLAQDSDIILTIGVDQYQADYLDEEVFAAFEESHPGVKVVPAVLDDESRWFGTPSTTEDVAEFMTNIQNFASQADLLPLTMPGTNALYTRAGAFLDISPLMNADPNANLEDFYPVMLQSYQWDGGTWGLPITANLQFLAYNKTAFDDAGLAYPDENWTLQDWMNAGRVLTTYDDEGNVEIPGFFGFDDAMLLAAEYNQSLYDASSELNLSDPELMSLLESWAAFSKETQPAECCNFDWNELPIGSGGVYYLDPNMMMGNGEAEWGLTFLPNGKAGMYLQGFAISGGTENPQLAYELLQYMTNSPEIAMFLYGDVNARQSLAGVEVEDDRFFRPDLSPEALDFISRGVENAIPAAEIEAFRIVQQAMWLVNDPEAETEMTMEEALQKVQEDNATIVAAVDEAASSSVVVVATAIPTPVLSAGEVSLNFGMEMWYGPGSGDDLWRTAIDEFVAQDPEVGQITIDSEYFPIEQRAEEQDCFYVSYNSVQNMDLSLVRSLDPYLQADANFDPNDMVGGTMEQVVRDDMTWALPMSLMPLAMWYDPTAFEEAGLPMPTSDWTVSEWEDAMRTLYNGEDAVFQTQNWGGSYIMMLAAAYGGVPMDYSATPDSITADPAAINAVMEVLDLAKEGLIDYQELVSNGGGFGGNGTTMFDAVLMPNDYRLQYRDPEQGGDPHRVVMFPSGADFTPVSYTLSVGFISAQTPAADACYRWLSFLSTRPELLGGMPAHRSIFEAALEFITEGEDVVQFYRDFDAALSSGNALIMAQPYGNSTDDVASGTADYLASLWLYQAFDNYVLNDGDLEADLLQAQSFQADYATCASAIPPRNYSEFDFTQEQQDEFTAYYFQYVECAVAVDPELREQFQYIYDQMEGSESGGGGGGGGN